MTSRQSMPEQWLIADQRPGPDLWHALQDLPRGSGVLLLVRISPGERRRLRHLAIGRNLTLAFEADGTAARVHNNRELTKALLKRIPLVLLSPIYETRSHPGWRPLKRMRAAALASLGGRRLIALGGMNERRFRLVRRLGFIAWAGISAWSQD